MKLKTIMRAAALGVVVLTSLVPARGQGFSGLRKAAETVAPPPNTLLRAVMVNNDNWSSADEAGIYTIQARPGGEVKCIHHSPAFAGVVAAVTQNQTMYAVEAGLEGFFYRSWSTSTWNAIGSRQEIDVVNVPSDLTYDPVTKKVYGGFYDQDNAEFSRFASFNVISAEASDITDPNRDQRDFVAIAAAPNGTIYALFGMYNYLITVDSRRGAIERIGRTGLDPELNMAEGRISSMCYDAENNRLLAMVCSCERVAGVKTYYSCLYQIDPKTAAATEIMRFDGASFAGLEIIDSEPSATAPAAPSALKVTPSADGTEAAVEFEMPRGTVGGSSLSGTLMAIVNINGAETVVPGLAAGEHVSLTEIPLNEGNNTLKVTAASESERGMSAELTFWAGDDVPLPVEQAVLTVGDGKATIRWSAPKKGINGGDVNPGRLKYTIVRYPDQKRIADGFGGTEYVDTDIDPSWKALWYSIKAYNNCGVSAEALTNKCPASGALDIPFVESFDAAADFDVWTVQDLNGSVTWAYDKSGKCAVYKYPQDNTPGDDWLISPPLRVHAGQTYKVAYDYRVQSDRYAESFDVAIAFAPGHEAMKQTIASHQKVTNTKYTRNETSFTATEDGTAYLGFHCVSEPKMWSVYIDNVNVEAIDNRVPAAIADFEVKASPDRALKAIISFTPPALDAEGSALQTLKSATVMRNGVEVKQFSDIKPSQKIEWTDTEIPGDGIYTYTVTTANAVGSSVASTASAYIGTDAPGAPVDFILLQQNGKPLLSWKAPETGLKGGYYDGDAVTYRIIRSDGNVVAEAVKDLSFLDESYSVPTNTQDPVYYVITAWGGTLHGGYAQSEPMLFGKPYATPFAETFPQADMSNYPWMAQSYTAVYNSWTLDNQCYNPSAADQNGDRGVATFHAAGEPEGVVSYFYSPMISTEMTHPVLSFWMYHSPSIAGDGKLEVFLTDAEGNKVEVPGSEWSRAAGDSDGWQRHTVTLASVAREPFFRVCFVGTGDAAADICIDNICIDESLSRDAALTAFAVPARMPAGEDIPVEITVLNAGADNLEDIIVKVSNANGSTIAEHTIDKLASGEQKKLELGVVLTSKGYQTLTASVLAAGDENAANNSLSTGVTAVDAILPAPTELTATPSGISAVLTWNEPWMTGAVSDDFESYPDWAITEVGLWGMYDGDYSPTYYINNQVEYENAAARKAFQVLNVRALGIDIWDQGKAHSGNKLMAAMAAVDRANNDWLISPRLNGNEQWISLWARSFTLQDIPAEKMMIYASSTGDSPADFTAVSTDPVELGETWRQYRYFLPQGTKYFAIVCVSNESFAMFVDDVAFNDLTVTSTRPTGYEIFRDGVSIATVSTPTYTDTKALSKASYTVKALYGTKGSSADSNTALFDASGVDTPVVEAEIEAIYSPDGIMHTADVPLPSGVYIVRYTDGTIRKQVIQ